MVKIIVTGSVGAFKTFEITVEQPTVKLAHEELASALKLVMEALRKA